MMQQHKLMTMGHRHEHADCGEEADMAPSTDVPAYVFDAEYLGEVVPSGFNSVKIALDGALKADLDWEKERLVAREYVKRGLRIFWELRLGLFNHLEQAIGSQSQFLSFGLSLEHFRDRLWKEFQLETAGLCLYRGCADFSAGFPWDEEQRTNLQGWLFERFGNDKVQYDQMQSQETDVNFVIEQILNASHEGRQLLSLFCRDAAGEYLDLLAGRLPDNLKCYALLDGSAVSDPLMLALLTTKERFPRIHLGVKSAAIYVGAIAWDAPNLTLGAISRNPIINTSADKSNIGICLPAMQKSCPKMLKELSTVMSMLIDRKTAFRIVSEALLTTEWDGLDYLIVVSEQLSMQGRRKLQGFCAAGGIAVSVGDPLKLPQEISLSKFLQR